MRRCRPSARPDRQVRVKVSAIGVRNASRLERDALTRAYNARMRDLIFLATVVAFFVLAALFVRGCAWILEIGRREEGGR